MSWYRRHKKSFSLIIHILLPLYRIVEVFSWLLEVANDTKEHWEGARIIWSVSYVHDGPKAKDLSAEVVHPHDEHRKKLIAKLEIQKDDIQSVLPISKVRLGPAMAHSTSCLNSTIIFCSWWQRDNSLKSYCCTAQAIHFFFLVLYLSFSSHRTGSWWTLQSSPVVKYHK